ncbi:MAG: MOSC domain-containing protein [Actinobacteria bacterium]|nr:MOSC domain-containing protein [Actinomycetota bacterium]
MHQNGAKIISVNISSKKGVRKTPVGRASVMVNHGIDGDAHVADWHRQISLLAQESIDKMISMGLKVGPGDFAENLTTLGIDLLSLPIGTKLKVGGDIVLEVTQIGKECYNRCAIYRQAGDCVMPREGIFARVIHGGEVNMGDTVAIEE